MRSVLFLFGFLAVGAIASAAAAEPPPGPRKTHVPRFRVAHFGTLSVAVESSGGTMVHGVEFSYAAKRYLRIGGALVLPVWATSRDSCDVPSYGFGECSYNSYGLRGFAELHAVPGFNIDPWIRAGIGHLLHTSRHDALEIQSIRPDIAAFASAGLDINVGPVFLSGYVEASAFAGEQAQLAGGGARIGAQFDGPKRSPAQTSETEDERYPLARRPRPQRWKVGPFVEYRRTLAGDGATFTYGVDVSYEVVPHFRLGGSVVLPFVSRPGHTCYTTANDSSEDCAYNSFGLIHFAEVHGSTDALLDPWLRAGMGTMLHTSYNGFVKLHAAEPDLQFFASSGLDLNLETAYVGAYATIAAFVGHQGHLAGGGAHLGGRF